MGRFDTGTVDVHNGITVDVGISLIDELEEVDPVSASQGERDKDAGFNRNARLDKTRDSGCRRRLEDRLEELKLQRQINDYSFRVH